MSATDARGGCGPFRELMLDEAVEELSPSDAGALAAHAAACPACAAARADLRKAMIRTRSLLVPEPDPRYWDHFVPRLHERIRTSQAVDLGEVRQKLHAVRATAPATEAVTSGAAPPWGAAPPRASRSLGGPGLVLAGLAAAAALVLALVPAVLRGSRPPAPEALEARAPAIQEPQVLEPLGPEAGEPVDDAEILLATVDGPDALDEMLDGLSDEEVEALEAWLASEAS